MAQALKIPRANGWLKTTFMKDGVETPIDGLRVSPKGYGVPRAARAVTVDGSETNVTRLEARVAILTNSLDRAKTDLAAALAAQEQVEEVVEEPALDGAVIENERRRRVELNASEERRVELRAMKVKALQSIAKTHEIKGRSKLKTAELIDAIMSAEFGVAAS